MHLMRDSTLTVIRDLRGTVPFVVVVLNSDVQRALNLFRAHLLELFRRKELVHHHAYLARTLVKAIFRAG